MTISRGGYRFNRAIGRFVQTVVLTNIGTTITGPVSLVLDNLSPNAGLYQKTGVTNLLVPANSPYATVVAGNMAIGAKISMTLEFTDPTMAAITYSTRILAGPGGR